MKKRLLSIILTIAIVLSLASVMSITSSADISPDGIFTYEVIGNEVTITGYTAGTLDGELEIPATITGLPVTAIDDYAFNGCDITALKVPTGVKRIGKSAFYYCSKLENIQLPNSVNRIGISAFDYTKWYSNQSYTYVYAGKVLYKCKNNSITGISTLSGNALNSDTVGIADGAFKNFDSLTTVHLPNSIEVIGKGAFEDCDSLSYVSLPTNLTFIGNSAFCDCVKLETIKCNFSDDLTQMSNLTTIESDAFESTKWLDNQSGGSVYFANVLYTFKLSPISVTVKAGTKGIADGAMENCSTMIYCSIPKSVEHIGDYVFDWCSNLGSLVLEKGNENYYESGNCIIEKETGKLIYGAASATIPSGVKIIGDSAFFGRDQLESIEIPIGVTQIEDYAFGGCTNLKSVYIPSSVKIVGHSAFGSDSALTTVKYSCGESERAHIGFSEENDPIKNATWTYHYGRKSFPDVSYNGSWYGTSVEYAVGAGLMKGYESGKFGTSDGIQRQDFVVILSRLSGENIEYYADKANFKDAAKGSYYAAALAWAKARGVSTGYANGKFGVGDKITREQIVTFLYRFAQLKGYSTDLKPSATLAKKNYPDASSVSSYADNAIIWALGNNVIGGKEIGGKKYLAPGANAQRSEVAKMFYNIFMNDVFTVVVR